MSGRDEQPGGEHDGVVVGLLTFVFVLGVMWATFALLGVPSWIPDSWVERFPASRREAIG